MKRRTTNPSYTVTEKQLDDLIYALDVIDRHMGRIERELWRVTVSVNCIRRIREAIRTRRKP